MIDRRCFLAAAGLAATASAVRTPAAGAVPAVPAPHPAQPAEGDDHRGPCSISSSNGARAVETAMRLMSEGKDPVVAVVEGVAIVEADPDDMSVGYGGLPNEDGVVQLDASVMHGPTHKAGAVACLENIMHPSRVALEVLRRIDHVLLVGEGAKRFALKLGFKEENLLTERARREWLRWKANSNENDDWLDDRQLDWSPDALGMGDDPMFTYGTIHCAGVDPKGNIGAVTTTSGLSWKIPGRVGDSPIIGAGMYVDNAVGAAGGTGRGEAAIQNCAAFAIVQHMERGLTPTQACLEVLKKVANNTREKRLLDSQGRPNFGLTLYALRKDGAYGSATLKGKESFTVHTQAGPKKVECASLYE